MSDDAQLFKTLVEHWITRLADANLEGVARSMIRNRYFHLERLHTAAVYLRWGNPINRVEIEHFVKGWKRVNSEKL